MGVVAVGRGADAAAAALCLAPALAEAAVASVAVLLPLGAHSEVGLAQAIDAGVDVVEAPAWPPDFRALVHAVRELRGRHAHVLVPLSTGELHSDPLAFADAIDGIVLVGRAGTLREHDLLSANIARDKELGVVLLQG